MVKSKSSKSELIHKIIFGIEDVKGADVNIMDLTNIANTVCGYFIICTGTSNTHVSAIVNSIKRHVSKQLKEKPFSIEGNENQEWVLIDYIDVVVHVFQKEIREYYDIENLWGDAKIKKLN